MGSTSNGATGEPWELNGEDRAKITNLVGKLRYKFPGKRFVLIFGFSVKSQHGRLALFCITYSALQLSPPA